MEYPEERRQVRVRGVSYPRAAGALVTGGALWALAAAIGGTDGGDRFYLAESIWLVAQLALLLGTIELWRCRPHGRARIGGFGFALATLGRVLFVVAELLALTSGEVQDDLLPAAVLPTALGMLLAGIGIARAHVHTAWARWTPVLVGVYPFVLMIPFAAVADEPPVASLLGWGLMHMLLGSAVVKFGRDETAVA